MFEYHFNVFSSILIHLQVNMSRATAYFETIPDNRAIIGLDGSLDSTHLFLKARFRLKHHAALSHLFCFVNYQSHRIFKQQNGIVPRNRINEIDNGECKRESNIFCKLGRIVLSNNKMVLYRGILARPSQQYRMSGECKKENPISFACLDVSYFQTTKW
jgi:hypothetical protein